MTRFSRAGVYRHLSLLGLGVAIGFSALQPQALADDDASSGNLVAQLLQRVSALEAQERELRGDVDQLNNLVKTQADALAKKIDDAQFASGAKSASAQPTDSAPASASASPAESDANAPQMSAADLLKVGRSSLRARDFAVSQQKAQAALKLARDQKTRIGARFLLAQSLAGQKDFKGSAVAYYDAYRAAPHAETAQESLLGVSAAMLALGRNKDACEALVKMRHDFPQMSARITNAYNSFHRRAHCN